jgi:LacI family transcriptional regulator
MHDVALAAGVSVKTVSRVVNAEGGVRDDLVSRVEDAVRTLNYYPDERARNLRQSDPRTASIGFAMDDVSNPFFSSIFRGLEEVARQHDYLVLSGSSDGDPARQDQLIETFISRRVDGLVVVPSSEELGLISSEILRGTPVVFVDCEPSSHQSDLVRSDHLGGTYAITAHLIAHGHQHIAFLGDDPRIFSANLRLEGFRNAVAAAGLTTPKDWVLTARSTPSEWYETIREWWPSLSDRPTALVTAQNFVTIGAVQALRSLDIHRQIALVGFDDFTLSDAIDPAITVMPQQPLELGRRAGELLFRRLAGSTEPPDRQILQSEIIVRGSGELPPRSR